MRNSVYLLIAVVGLYLILGFGLQVIYGPSYGFLSGEDSWVPDGQGGWEKHGEPSDPPPTEPSRNVPIGVRYIPIFVPGLLLLIFLFTPLSRKLEPRKKVADADAEPVADDSREASPPNKT
jgi:hypothetical protein